MAETKNKILETLRYFRPHILGVLAFFILGEIVSRGLDARESWQKYQAWSTKTADYRGQTYSVKKPEGYRRVLLLGGSAVHDTASDYRETWPHFLEQKLRAELGEKIEVINMGFYSETSTDELFKLNDFGLELAPDLVIVFDGENDVYNLWHMFDFSKRLYETKTKNLLREKKKHSFFTRFFGNLRKNWSFYQRLNRMKKETRSHLSIQALQHQRDKAPASPEKLPAIPAPSATLSAEDRFFENPARWDEIYQGYLEIYGSNLDKMGKLIQRAGAKGLFISQPDLSYKELMTGQVSPEEKAEFLTVIGRHEAEWREIQKRTYPEGLRLMRSTAEKYALSFHDFNQAVLTQGDVSRLFEGNVHFTPEGRKLIAELIADIILSENLLS